MKLAKLLVPAAAALLSLSAPMAQAADAPGVQVGVRGQDVLVDDAVQPVPDAPAAPQPVGEL